MKTVYPLFYFIQITLCNGEVVSLYALEIFSSFVSSQRQMPQKRASLKIT